MNAANYCFRYCENVIFYMSLKAKRASVENHPVTRRLVDFRKVLSTFCYVLRCVSLAPSDRSMIAA